jgi:hypothetical protein
MLSGQREFDLSPLSVECDFQDNALIIVTSEYTQPRLCLGGSLKHAVTGG